MICSGSPLHNGRYGRPRGASLRLRWQLSKGRASRSRAALLLWEYSTACTYRRYSTGPLTWEVVSTSLGAQHGKERASRLRHMRDAWLLLRTIGRPGGCREHGTRASVWFSLPSSPARLGGQRLARVAAGRPPLKTHVACGAGMSLGGTGTGRQGRRVTWFGSEQDGRYAEASPNARVT